MATILRECPSARDAGMIDRTRGQLVYRGINGLPSVIQGCDPELLNVREWTVVAGSCFVSA